MSDSDAAFKGSNRDEDQNFQKILSNNNAVLEPVTLNDHHALGIIDNFAKTLKRILSKEFLDNKNTKCRRRRCLRSNLPTNDPPGPPCTRSDAHGDASDTKKGALSKHPLTDAARTHTHHRCISQMQIEPSLSLRCGKNRGLPFLAHAVVRDVTLHQCACNGHHGGHRLCSYWTDAVGAHVE